MHSSIVSSLEHHQLSNLQIGKRYSMPNALLMRNSFQPQPASPQAYKINQSIKKKPNISSREQIVYVDNKAFIVAKNDRNTKAESPKKVIEINGSRSKSTQKRESNSVKKLSNSNQYKIFTPVRVPLKAKQGNSTDSKERQNERQKEKLTRKINILEKRISQLHYQKQNSEMNFIHQNTLLIRQLQIKQQRIMQLQAQLQIVSCELQNKSRELQEVQQRLEEEKEKQYHRVCAQRDQYKSITTQNFINLALSEEIEKVKECNQKLQLELMNCRTQNQKQQNCIEQTKDRWRLKSDKNLADSTKNKPNSNTQHTIRMQNIFEESHEILEVDSQHMQIDEIICQIHQMTKENDQLKNQLQECKNQLFVKDSISNETARIMNEIKEVVMNAKDQVGGINKIKDILSQIF